MINSSDTELTDNVVQLFKKEPSSPNLGMAMVPGQRLSLASVEDNARNYAIQERFDRMCEDILWGSEDRVKFIHMLRGLVDTFLPETRYHLQLLKTVASFTWQLERIGVTQHRIFENATGKIGKFRLPQATHDAMSLRPEASRLLKDLQVSIRLYNYVRGRIS